MNIPSLKSGDKVAITAPAKQISHEQIKFAVAVLESWGMDVVVGETIGTEHYQFSAETEVRRNEVQTFLDDPKIKAIFMARGGYGSIQLIDDLEFSEFFLHPKWIVGFSDITIFHCHIHQVLGMSTIHGTMPLNFESNTSDSLESLKSILFEDKMNHEVSGHKMNRVGAGEGEIIGGNLSILYSLLGSASFPNMDGKILFIEDLNEYPYVIDRMMYALRRAGALEGLSGLVVGQFTDSQEAALPFGKTEYEIIKDAVAEFDFPVCFNFPLGHVDDNRAIILGKKDCKLIVTDQLVKLLDH